MNENIQTDISSDNPDKHIKKLIRRKSTIRIMEKFKSTIQ